MASKPATPPEFPFVVVPGKLVDEGGQITWNWDDANGYTDGAAAEAAAHIWVDSGHQAMICQVTKLIGQVTRTETLWAARMGS